MPLPAGPVVGTCGFGYPEWRGRFYPPELGPGEWLGFYAQVFEAVELDGTFYRPPEPAQVAVWAEALPDRFAVSAKVPRAITHEVRLEGEAAAAVLAAFARSLEPFGDRRATPVIGRPVRDRSADLDRWAALLAMPDGARGTARRPAAAFANNRYEGAAFDTAAALRRRLGQPAVEPRDLWPAPPLPGLEP